MVQPVNTFPGGLLDLLGIRSLGRNPNSLSDELRGALELMPFYLQRGQIIDRESGAALTLAQQGPQIVIPDSELWVIKTISGTVSSPSGVGALMKCRLRARLDDTGTTNPLVLAESVLHTSVATTDQVTCTYESGWAPLIIQGPAVLQALLSVNVTGGFNVAVTVDALVTKLAV